jgi:CRP/FNR family transcriptional regulator, cyclic AMP receptor protein
MGKEIKNKPQKSNFDFIVAKIPFLSCLCEDELADLRRYVIEKQFKKNQVILYEDDTLNYLYFIYSGKVKVIQLSAEGQERIVAIRKRGEFFGEMAILDGMTAPATVVAMEETSVGFISARDFQNHLLQNRKVLVEIISMLCSRLREAWLMLKVLSFAGAEQRIKVVLKNAGDQFGVKDQRGTIINLKLRHKDIAELATTARETVTRSLKRLIEAEEIAILENKHILLKPAFFKKIDL